jgi:acetyl esterase/lipase
MCKLSGSLRSSPEGKPGRVRLRLASLSRMRFSDFISGYVPKPGLAIFSLLAALLSTMVAAPLPMQEDNVGAEGPAASSPSGAGAVTVEENISYAPAKNFELRLDIYQPAERGTVLRPAVMLIHGGGWTNLDKSTMHGMGQFLARCGFVAFSVDYRLLRGTENRWPVQLDDVQRAVRWVRANAARYGVNPEHIGAFGHSAGGQLASLLGMEETRDNSDLSLAQYSSKVGAVVDVSGPTDFTTDHNSDSLAFFANLLGTDYGTHPEVWREASPAFHVSKDVAPFLIVHGTQDQEVPVSQAQELFEKLQSAGVPVSLIKIDGGHTFQTPEARRQLAHQTLQFFYRYLVVVR